ncbi:PPOX class F420-dependent oxidoreductase [Nocardia mexicana]|uniref:PPOX class probable F420-dependent enzyme n=1 Tax=Nocardia mexicana TaxID=279262 RepID=A0A370H856_9NOCA|nr:PPOX class F420-dependent oxidoreductase [Nocardia mexicana]RDI52155.1 PPOX class probable F420-dependent enzyme [Nocardia mexicana]
MVGKPEAVQLDNATRMLVEGKNFATVATLNADGSPHTSVVWLDADDGAVVFSTTTNRRKGRNLARDPRVSLTVIDAENPYRTVDIAGIAELIDDPEKTLPMRLSHKYVDADPPLEPNTVHRLIVRVTPHRITGFTGTRS